MPSYMASTSDRRFAPPLRVSIAAAANAATALWQASHRFLQFSNAVLLRTTSASVMAIDPRQHRYNAFLPGRLSELFSRSTRGFPSQVAHTAKLRPRMAFPHHSHIPPTGAI